MMKHWKTAAATALLMALGGAWAQGKQMQMPRAFAIAHNGAWGLAEDGDDPLRPALFNCNRNGHGECGLDSVDDQVVSRGR